MQINAEDVGARLSDLLSQLFVSVGRVIALRTHEGGGLLSQADYATLGHVERLGCTRLTGLADAAGADASTLSRRIAALQERGLVERGTDDDDARARRISLTDSGRAVLTAERSARASFIVDVVGDWTLEDRAELARLLTQLNDSLTERR